MTRPQKQQRHGGNRGEVRSDFRPRSHYTRRPWEGPRLPRDWRERLPAPDAYYGQRVTMLGKPNAQGWAQGRCPFHHDKAKSLSVQLRGAASGRWHCFAGCGKGDLVAFHQRITSKAFDFAVDDLIGVRA